MKSTFILIISFINIGLAAKINNVNTPQLQTQQCKSETQNSLIDFGAVGDGKTDDSNAFVKALEAVEKSTSKKIIIPNNFVFNLGGKNIDFTKYVKGIILDFQGGILKNSIFKGNETRVNASRTKIFDNINLGGSFISQTDFAYPEWFGCFPNDKNVDLVDALTKLNTVFYDVSLGAGDYYTQKGEYMLKGIRGLSMAKTKVIMETDKSNTYIFSLGKVGGILKERNYDYNYIKDVTLVMSTPGKVRLKGNRGLIVGAAHKPSIENVKIFLFGDKLQLSKQDLEQFLVNPNKMKEANVGVEFNGDSEVSTLSNIFTLSDIGLLFSQYTDFVSVNNYMNWCGDYGLSNIYFTKQAVTSQNLLFYGSQSWNQGLYGFYSEDSNEWNTFRNNRIENVRIEQLTTQILANGKVASTSIRIGKSNLLANMMFENIILSGGSNGIYIGETPSGNIYFDKIIAYPDLTSKKDFSIKTKLVKPSSSKLELPLEIHFTNMDINLGVESSIENSNYSNKKNIDLRYDNKFSNTVLQYQN